MELIKFSLHGYTFDFDRDTLAKWMSVPLRASAKIDLLDREQAEAAFDLVCSQDDIPVKITGLLEQMDEKKFAKCFTITEDSFKEET